MALWAFGNYAFFTILCHFIDKTIHHLIQKITSREINNESNNNNNKCRDCYE